MSSSFQAPKGVSEYVPPQAEALLAVRQAFAEQARLAGYGYVELAVFEDTQLFKRGVGESTDVVTKEMYTFEDRGGRSITLRPEFTAGVLRAVLEYGLHKQGLPVKVWTVNQQADMHRLLDWGVDALISDRPDLAVTAVKSRETIRADS